LTYLPEWRQGVDFCGIFAIIILHGRQVNEKEMKISKSIFVLLGSCALAIGLLGIITPGLPTTPFLLLAAGLYLRGSEKLYNRLIANPATGPYILDYQRKKGMTLNLKIGSIALMWTMIGLSVHFFLDHWLLQAGIILLGCAGTVVMGFLVKTVIPEKELINRNEQEVNYSRESETHGPEKHN
jgi:uncharacterized membrane protein YbaN (DUF454 family)